MKLAKQDIKFGGQTLALTNQRVVFWEREKALILSDLHIGKTAHFRKNGIAVPKDILQQDLLRLEFLIQHFSPKKIIVVGDLLHAGDNSDVDEFCEWRNQFSHIEFHLVEGNHDRISAALGKKLCLTKCEKSLTINQLTFVHDFNEASENFQVTGHIHPGAVLYGAVKNIKLPCFTITEKQLLLPAFSLFTGLDIKNTPPGRRFVFTDKEIYEL